jgi:hypothetical protein
VPVHVADRSRGHGEPTSYEVRLSGRGGARSPADAGMAQGKVSD